MYDETDPVKATAKKKVKFPGVSANSKPRKPPKRKKKDEQARLLGMIGRGEL